VAEVAKQRADIEAGGTQVAFVHMDTVETARRFFTKYGLQEVHQISDSQGRLYRAFGLKRGTLGQLFSPVAFARGFQATFSGHGFGIGRGDKMQMPGVFLISKGEVVREFIHKLASDRPDYLTLARCDTGACQMPDQ
jgi:hypothetical protein